MKYYKVIKDHPLWEVGAILQKEKGDNRYRAIDDIFVKDVKGATDNYWYEDSLLVENRPEWFERVYKISILKQAKYVVKDKAKKILKEQYEGKE